MVTSMTEQPGPRDPAERRTTDRQAKGVDVFGDLQRWFIRQSAKNMRKEISGQVRRTIGGGNRPTSDVWDTATNEIPPEVGESPECQWCPICRAARRMRDSGPGIGGQISGAGDVVASAVQDAIGALDSLLSKASGTGAGGVSTAGDSTAGDSAATDSTAGNAPARDSGPRDAGPSQNAPSDTSATSATSDTSADSAAASWPGSASPDGATAPDRQHVTSDESDGDTTAPDWRRDRHGLVGLPGGGDSAAADRVANGTTHGNGAGPAGQSADRPADAPGSEADPWGAATKPAEADGDTGADDRSDGPGHGPDDRR
jgi:hypothetical protein